MQNPCIALLLQLVAQFKASTQQLFLFFQINTVGPPSAPGAASTSTCCKGRSVHKLFFFPPVIAHCWHLSPCFNQTKLCFDIALRNS